MEKSYRIWILTILCIAFIRAAFYSAPAASQGIALMWEESCCSAPTWHVCCGGPMEKILYIFLRSSTDAVKGAHFRLALPNKLSPGNAEYIDYAYRVGDPTTGLDIVLSECIAPNQPVLIVRQQLVALSEINEMTAVTVEPWPGENHPRVLKCDLTSVVAAAFGGAINMNLFLCDLGPASASGGAIKEKKPLCESCPPFELTAPSPVGVKPRDTVTLLFSLRNSGSTTSSWGMSFAVTQSLDWQVTTPGDVTDYMRCQCTKSIPVTVHVPESESFQGENTITLWANRIGCDYVMPPYEYASTTLTPAVGTKEYTWGGIRSLFE